LINLATNTNAFEIDDKIKPNNKEKNIQTNTRTLKDSYTNIKVDTNDLAINTNVFKVKDKDISTDIIKNKEKGIQVDF
jgi:hypothetical protein